MNLAANDNAAPFAILATDIGDGVTAVTCGRNEVRIAINYGHDNFIATAKVGGCEVGAFSGKTYKGHAGAVRAAAKWLAASAG